MLPELTDYKIENELGQGGMASVYQARHLRLDRPVALKIMHSELVKRDPQFSERFLREARIAADLSNPYIVQVYDVNSFDGYHYIAMEFVSGGDLSQRIKQYIDFDTLLKIVANICSALDYAHDKGYVHRDIKPANILFRANGDALVSDFGIARAVDSSTQMTELGTVLGTPTYMSPEQASGKAIDGRSDLYAVAVMIYQILTGKPPYDGETSLSIAIQHINDPIPVMPEPLGAIQGFIDKAMAKSPADRFERGDEMLAALKQALADVHPEDLTATRTMVLENLQELAATEVTPIATGSAETQQRARPVEKTNTTITIRLPEWSPRHVAMLVAAILLGVSVWWLLPKKLSDTDRARVELILSNAREDMLAGRYVSPAGQSALDKYYQAETIAPNYPETQLALNKLAALLMEKSEQAQQAKQWQEARDFAEQTLKVIPDHPEAGKQLVELAAQIEQNKADIDRKRQSIISAMTSGQWQQAVTQYKSLSVEEKSSELTTVFVEQAEKSLKIAQTKSKAGQYADAQQAFSTANLLAKTANNAALSRDIKRAESNSRKVQQINNLLKSAEAEKEPLTALEKYQKVLKISPKNTVAQQGMSRGKQDLIENTREAIAGNDMQYARRGMATLERLRQSQQLDSSQLSQYNNLRRAMKISSAEQEELAILFDRFDRYMQKPKVTSAYKIYRRIESITTSHPKLPQLRQRLGDGYLALAEKEAAAGDWDDVLTWCQRGLQASPQHKGLLAIQAQAAEQLPEGRKKLFGVF